MTKRKKSRKRKRSTDRSASLAAQRVAETIATAGPNYIRDNFIRIMQGSADLEQEKEFASFYLDPLPLLEAATRCFPRFRRRAKRAVRRGGKENPSLYDDYRIAVLGDLDTPHLRQRLQKQLDRCVSRLVRGHDEAKIENALFLSALLSDSAGKILKGKKPLPLGLYGLVTAIYENSFDRAMETVPDAQDIVGNEIYDLWCIEHAEEDMAAINVLVEQLDRFEDMAARLESDRALAWAWKRQASSLSTGLWLGIAQGAISFNPAFVTPDEIALSMDRMEQRYWSKPWSLSRYLLSLAVVNFVYCVRETLDDPALSSRAAKLIEALSALGQSCLDSDDEQNRALVPAIQAAIDDVRGAETPSQSRTWQVFYLQGFFKATRDADSLSPHWQRFLKHLEKSRRFERLSITDL